MTRWARTRAAAGRSMPRVCREWTAATATTRATCGPGEPAAGPPCGRRWSRPRPAGSRRCRSFGRRTRRRRARQAGRGRAGDQSLGRRAGGAARSGRRGDPGRGGRDRSARQGRSRGLGLGRRRRVRGGRSCRPMPGHCRTGRLPAPAHRRRRARRGRGQRLRPGRRRWRGRRCRGRTGDTAFPAGGRRVHQVPDPIHHGRVQARQGAQLDVQSFLLNAIQQFLALQAQLFGQLVHAHRQRQLLPDAAPVSRAGLDPGLYRGVLDDSFRSHKTKADGGRLAGRPDIGFYQNPGRRPIGRRSGSRTGARPGRNRRVIDSPGRGSTALPEPRSIPLVTSGSARSVREAPRGRIPGPGSAPSFG